MARPIDPRLLRRTQPAWLAAGVGVGLTTAILVISQAWLLSHVVVSSINARRLVEAQLLGILAIVFVGRALCAWATHYVAYRAAIGVKATLRHDVVEARLASPATPTSSAGLITVLSTGLDALDGYFAKYLPQFVLASIVPFVVIGVVFTQDWISALIIVVTLPLIPVFMALVGWKTQERVDRRWAIHERLACHFGDVVAGLPTLQVFGRAKAQERGLAVTEAAHRRETMSTLCWSFMSSLVLELIATLSVAVVAVAIGLRVVTGDMAFFPALFVLVLAPEAYLPLRLVGMHYHDSADGTAAANAAFEIIDQAPVTRPGSRAVTAISTVEFRDVSYRYPNADIDALSGLSLRLAPGRIVALSGPSGGGKSTAISCLLGFLTPTGGTILLDGEPLSDVDLRSWRKHLAYVAQTPGLIAGNVADNVRLGNPAATDAEIGEALLRAGATDIDPSTNVGDDGEGLSAGERRRVGIARALLRLEAGASILLLDEPTAGLDHDAEAAVLESIGRSGAGALVVSHRDTVLAAADEVITV